MFIMLKKRCFKKHLFIVWGDFHNLKDNYDVAVDSCVFDCLMRLMEGEHQAIDLGQWRLLLSIRCFASLCAFAEWPFDQISCFLSFSFFTFTRSAGHSPSFQPADSSQMRWGLLLSLSVHHRRLLGTPSLAGLPVAGTRHSAPSRPQRLRLCNLPMRELSANPEKTAGNTGDTSGISRIFWQSLLSPRGRDFWDKLEWTTGLILS